MYLLKWLFADGIPGRAIGMSAAGFALPAPVPDCQSTM